VIRSVNTPSVLTSLPFGERRRAFQLDAVLAGDARRFSVQPFASVARPPAISAFVQARRRDLGRLGFGAELLQRGADRWPVRHDAADEALALVGLQRTTRAEPLSRSQIGRIAPVMRCMSARDELRRLLDLVCHSAAPGAVDLRPTCFGRRCFARAIMREPRPD
jgi:hypothetical protein